MAVGAKVEAPLPPTLACAPESFFYNYTAFSRGGDPDLPEFNSTLTFMFSGSSDAPIPLKLRLIEEGPIATKAVPLNSSTIAPVFEIRPWEQKRSIIAYGRILIEPLAVGDASREKFMRVELKEVSSGAHCGELALAVYLSVQEEGPSDADALFVPSPRSGGNSPVALDRSSSSVSSSGTSPMSPVESSRIFGRTEEDAYDLAAITADEAQLENEAGTGKPGTVDADDDLLIEPASTGQDGSAEDALQQTISPISRPASTTPSNEIIGLLSLEIVAAQDLPRERRFLRSSAYGVDSFVVISFGKQSFRTKVCRDSLSPVFKERLAFSVRSTEQMYQVIFSVYDYENFRSNSCLGTISVYLAHFTLNPEQRLKLALPLNLAKPSKEPRSPCLLVKGSFTSYEQLRRSFWRRLLKSFDLNSNGHLCRLEFETMLESLGSTLSEGTIAKVFDAVDQSVNQEIKIEDAVSCLEDLTLRPPSHTEGDDGENLVVLNKCPFCQKLWSHAQKDIDVITHLGICSASEEMTQQSLDRFVMSGFMTEEYASRKWFMRLLSFMSFGNYQIGRNNGNIFVQDRKSGKLLEERMPTYIRLGIRMLHQNVVTYRTAVDFGYARGIFQSLTIQQGRKYDHPSSVKNIPRFIRYHQLPVHEIAEPLTCFRNFNEFFYRKLKLEYRPIAGDEQVLVSPADCRINVFASVDDATRLWIKGLNFSIANLLKDADEAAFFARSALVLCRLAPQDYHRFHSPVAGKFLRHYHIPGTYYTVNPMAVRQKVDVFTENARAVMIVESGLLGRVAIVAVGAMMVGSIVITATANEELARGSELGYFAFGGSTLVVLFERTANVEWDADLLANSNDHLETLIQMGDSIGRIG